eukprot:gene9454-9264_t
MSTFDHAGLMQGINESLSTFRKAQPDTMRGFSQLAQAAMAEGALSAKHKELIALAIGVSQRCSGCIGFHVKALLKLGATRQEVEEMLGVCVYMGGGPSLMYTAEALAAWDKLAQGRDVQGESHMAADHRKHSALCAWALRTLLCAVPLLLVSHVAQALDKPTGTVVLTVEGNISAPNQGAKAQFDMPMLEKLPQHTFTTRTPWYPDAVTFTGPLLRDVLAAAGSKGNAITAVALNDYKTEIPMDDVHRHEVIVARLMNNRPMPIREKGPLFIIYPFDTKTELRTE